jgi:hypothetical protein
MSDAQIHPYINKMLKKKNRELWTKLAAADPNKMHTVI